MSSQFVQLQEVQKNNLVAGQHLKYIVRVWIQRSGALARQVGETDMKLHIYTLITIHIPDLLW